MTEERKVDWGAEIPVNGKRPEWLKDTDLIQWRWESANDDEWHEEYAPYGLPAAGVNIENGCQAIRLSANHPHYAEAPRNSESPTLPDDLTARMVELVKRVAVEPRNLIEEHAEARAIVAELEPVDEHEAYADALLKQQGWHGEPSIGFAAVARMIATAHEDGRALERGEGE